MRVESPISRVIVDEDGINFEAGRGVFRIDRAGQLARMTSIVVKEVLGKWPDSGVCRDYITGSDDVAESVSANASG